MNDEVGPPKRLDKADVQQLAEEYACKRYESGLGAKKNRKKFKDLALELFRSDEFKYEVDQFAPTDLSTFGVVLGDFVDLTKVDLYSKRCDPTIYEKHWFHMRRLEKEFSSDKDHAEFSK